MLPISAPSKPGQVLVTEIVGAFLASFDSKVARGLRKPHTAQNYRRSLSLFVEALPGDLRARDVQNFHVPEDRREDWHYVQATKAVFNWAFREGRLKCCPLASLPMPATGERTRTFRDDELSRLLDAFEHYHRVFYWVMWRTGARPIELRELKWHAVDFDQRILKIFQFKKKRETRKKKPYRPVPIDLQVTDLLQRIRLQPIVDRERGALRLPTPGDCVFLGRYGQPFTKDAICQAMTRACKRAGVQKIDESGEAAVSYTMRHTFGTEFTDADANQKLISDLMGHADPKTTQKYQHVQARTLVHVVDRVRADQAATGRPENLLHSPGARKIRRDQPGLFDRLG